MSTRNHDLDWDNADEGDEVDLSGLSFEPGALVPEDLPVYEDDEGLYALGEEDDEDDDPTPEEQALFNVMLDAVDGDVATAIRSYAAFEDQMEAAHVGQQDQATYTPTEFNTWMAAHPAVEAAGVDEFLPYVHRADGNLDAAYELFSYNLDNLREAAEKEGHRVGPKVSMKDAVDDAFSEGLLGTKAKTYEHRETGDAMDDALGGFQEILSIKNAVRDQARGRVRKMRRPD